MYYLDLSTTPKDTQDCIAQVNISQQLPTKINKCAIAKFDIQAQLPLCRVPLQQPQSFSQAVAPYGEEINGFLTTYKIKTIIKPYGRDGEGDVYVDTVKFINETYTNEEAQRIQHRPKGASDEIDNFDDYFTIFSINQLLSCVNKTIQSRVSTLTSQYASIIADNFVADNSTNINIYLLDQTVSSETGYTRIMNYKELITFSQSNAFTIGYNPSLYHILFANLPYVKDEEGFMFPSNINTEGLKDLLTIEKDTTKFKLIHLTNKYYYDICRDFVNLCVVSNLPTNTLSINVFDKDFDINKRSIKATASSLAVLDKFGVNNQQEAVFRMVYSNNNILNNYSTISSLNTQSINAQVFVIDKLGFITPLRFRNDSDYFFIKLAFFN